LTVLYSFILQVTLTDEQHKELCNYKFIAIQHHLNATELCCRDNEFL